MSFKKSVAVSALPFSLFSATNGSPMTTGTPVGYYTVDGGVQATLSNAPVHVGHGQWKIALTPGEMNGSVIGLVFTLAGAINTPMTISTVAKEVIDLTDIAPDNTSIAAILTDTGTTLPAQITGLPTPPTVTEFNARTLPSASYFNPTTDTVSNVTLVATTTTNTDMVGTNGANTIAPDNVGINAKLSAMQGATFNGTTDSLEAIRNQGDAAWTTGAGGSSPTVAQIRTELDANSTKLAAIVTDTNELQLNQGNWLTASGFSTFNPVTDTVANVTAVTNAVTLPIIPNNWISAAGVVTGALNGKGNWNIGKTGYSLTQAFPTNFADLSITATTGLTSVGINNDKTGYSISGTKTTLDSLNDLNASAIVSNGAITTSAGAVANVTTTTNLTNGSGLTAQQVRDSLKLAPSAGIAATGSIDDNINKLPTTTEFNARSLPSADYFVVGDYTAPDNASVSTILTNTGTDIPALINGLTDITPTGIRAAVGLATANMDTQFAASTTAAGFATPVDILTTPLVESYAAKGVAPTLSQALYNLICHADNFGYAGTVKTTYKLDGVTTAGTYTLDDAITPTKLSKAT